jgi:hypothetical protein
MLHLWSAKIGGRERFKCPLPHEQTSGPYVDHTLSLLAKEEVMGQLPLVAVVASTMWALPAFAGIGGNAIPSKPELTFAQFRFCVGPDCGERDPVYRERRYFDRYDNDWRYRDGAAWRYRGEGCRDVTIRERRGDEVVVKRVRRCD